MRTQTFEKLDNSIFSMASHLFGYGQDKQKTAIENTIAMPLQCPDTLMAVYPAITLEAFASTMDNYRKYIAGYNFKTQAENELVKKHNTSCKNFCEQNPLTEVQQAFKKVFITKHKALKPRAYNALVDAFCNGYGLIVEKRKIQEVKYTSELVFQNLLHLYNAQMTKRNQKFISAGISVKRPLPEFCINSYLVTQLKRKEVQSIDICPKTVRNHRERLQEAGVLVDYHFAGQKRGVQVHINPDILVFLDMKTSKNTIIENQSITFLEGKELPDNNESTRTLKNKDKINENVDNISQKVRSSSEALTDQTIFFTGTPNSKQEYSTMRAGEKQPIKAKTLSDRLQELILHPQELAEGLAQGEYQNYTPIDIRYLYKEAFSGTLTNDEFRELAIQDFFKSIARIYNHSTPFVGSWKKAINLYYQNKWIAFTGHSFNKSVLVDEIQQMRWRIQWARKWFAKHQFPPLFPYDYFDMTRQSAKEVGFEYTKIKWKEHLQAQSKYESLKKKQIGNATRRKEAINHAKKCQTIINRFFNDKLTYTQLYDYVKDNLPKEFLEKLPQMLLKKSLEQSQKDLVVSECNTIKYSQLEF